MLCEDYLISWWKITLHGYNMDCTKPFRTLFWLIWLIPGIASIPILHLLYCTEPQVASTGNSILNICVHQNLLRSVYIFLIHTSKNIGSIKYICSGSDPTWPLTSLPCPRRRQLRPTRVCVYCVHMTPHCEHKSILFDRDLIFVIVDELIEKLFRFTGLVILCK